MNFLKNEKIIILIIIIFATFLRLIELDRIPSGFYHDEVLSSYEAYSVLKTGGDHWGNVLPLNFKAFGDYVPPLYFYFNVPFVFIFGLNEWVIRFPAAILGIFTVWLTYLLVKELFKNKLISLFSAFLMAISPWHLHYSRLGFPAIILPFLISLGLWLFFASLNQQKSWKLYLAIFFISLTVWAYTPAQIFSPLLLIGLFIFYRKKIKPKNIIICFLIGLSIIGLIYLMTLFHPEWRTRFSYISIFNQSQPILVFIKNYLAHLSFKFLFQEGDANLRHHLWGIGQLYFFEVILFFSFFASILLKREKFQHLPFLFFWLFLFPISSSLTTETIPHATRTIVALPLLHIFSALGLYVLYVLCRKKYFKIFAFSMTGLVLCSFTYFSVNYYLFYPTYSAPWFFHGQKEIVEYIKNNYEKYEKIIISGKRDHPYLYLLFYLNWHPKKFQNDPELKKEKVYDVLMVDSFDKFNFVYRFPEDIKNKLEPNNLYIEYCFKKYDDIYNICNENESKEKISLNEKIEKNQIKKIIYFPDGSMAYRIMARD